MVVDGNLVTSRWPQDLPAFPYAKYAQLIGLGGIEVTTPDQIAPALDQALAADRPMVVECHVDPEVPPLPPHITFEQAKHFMEALVKDPERGAMIKDSVKQMLEKFKK